MAQISGLFKARVAIRDAFSRGLNSAPLLPLSGWGGAAVTASWPAGMKAEMEQDNVRALRRANRRQLILPARCRSRSGFLDQVVISDLSEHGCRIDSLGLILRVGDMVVARPARIAFDRPLYAPVAGHLHRSHERCLTPDYLANPPGKPRLAA